MIYWNLWCGARKKKQQGRREEGICASLLNIDAE
jgi:hypothetical protein